MPYIIKVDELMHYGRKGMKWGQHIFGDKAKALRGERYREREIKKVQKRHGREEAMYSRKEKKAKTPALRGAVNRNRAKARDRAEREISALRRMSLAELQEERKAVGKLRTEVALHNIKMITIGNLVPWYMWPSQYDVGPYRLSKASSFKTKRRLS